ncbi:putative lipoprotein [Flavobacterium daejeonense]|nr:putative lipoprotein [Flavobacterium daejeonense]
MKKSILAFSAVILMASCNKKESKGNLHLTGNVKGLKEGTLYIQKVVDTTLIAIDTIKIDGNSHFESDLDIKSPEMLYLFLDRGVTNSLDNNLMFFAEPGIMNIETNLDSFLSGAKITGSKNQELYEEYKKTTERYKDENLNLIEQKFKAIKRKDATAVDSLNKLQDLNLKRRYLFAVNFAMNNKDHEIAPYIALAEVYDINIKYLDTIHKALTPKVAQSMYGKKLTNYIEALKKAN